MKALLHALAAALPLLLCSCPGGPQEAEVATYESLAPWIREKADPELERDRSKLGVQESWGARLGFEPPDYLTRTPPPPEPQP